MNIFAYLCDTKNFKNKEKWNLSKYALTDERNSPNSIVRDFVRKLNQWIDFHPTLRSELHALVPSDKVRTYTPAQVQLIYNALGEPY